MAILALAAGAAAAQTADFSLPSQPLSESLKEVARQTGQNILFVPQTVAGITAPSLRGQMSGQDAVNCLLKGTDLEADPDGAGGLIVRAAQGVRSGARGPSLPPAGGNGRPNAPSSVQSLPLQSQPQLPTQAQPEPAGLAVEQVVVSASRISIAGYEAPTPVTVIGIDQLERDSHFSIGDTIRTLPAVGISSSPVNGQGAANIVSAITGVDTVNLRNLGIIRTLVLFDGQRVVQSNITGGVDLSTIPATMVQRVDVVTGGASAAWGSDAVAGVVNLVLNKNFSGLKVNLQGGESSRGDLATWKGEVSYGADFDGDRGHFIFSGQYTDSPDVIFSGQRGWYQAQALVNNPAFNGGGGGQPQFIMASNVGLSQATTGGLIVGNPAGAAPGSADILRGIQFVGSAATPALFDFGNISGPLSNGGSAQHVEGELNDLTVAYHTTTFFGYGRYRLAPDLEASLQLNWGQSWTENNSVPAVRPGNLTIAAGNPFVPASVAAIMAADAIPSFNLGNINTNNITNFSHLSESELSASLGVPVNISTRQLARGVFTLEGALNDDWSWNSYYQHGTVRVHLHVLNDVVNQNYADAVDAVLVTAANVGLPGLPVGTIACRSTLSDPANGCQPLDVFGDGRASQGAINYIDTHNDFETIILNEDVVAASMQGQLPWALPAGKISAAFGSEYRKEGGRTSADPGAVARLYSVGNFNNFAGQYHVEEGFAEIEAPLLKDHVVDNLAFNAAGRFTYYSTSGLVETWKLGLTSRVNDDLRLRTTWSLDIRAPDLAELFSSGISTLSSAVDPNTGKNVSIYTFAEGNRALDPEIATTASGGVVITPHWLDGLSFSADWYSIVLKQSIYTASAGTVLRQCNVGNAFYCGQLVFGGPGGALSQIDTIPQNAASQTVSGLDFQGDYAMPFLSGTLSWHLVGNYTDEQTQTAAGTTFDYAGSLGGDSLIEGMPKFRANLSATYLEGPWSATVQTRFIGSGHINNGWSAQEVADNEVPAIAYLDLRGSYGWNDAVQFYAAIDNATNLWPPIIPVTQSGGQLSYYFAPIREDIYDAIGRYYRVGIRLNFPP